MASPDLPLGSQVMDDRRLIGPAGLLVKDDQAP